MYTFLSGLGVPHGGGGGHHGGGGGGHGGGVHHGGGGRRVVVNVQAPMPVFNDQPQQVIDGAPFLYAVDSPQGVEISILENNIWRVVGSHLAPADADKMGQFWRGKGFQVRFA